MACNSIYKGVHNEQSDTVLCGKRDFGICEEGISCSLITCAAGEVSEKVCVPRRFDHEDREEMCQRSGLGLTSEGVPADVDWGLITWVTIGVSACFICVCLTSCLYNYRLQRSNGEVPFAVPAFCPDCLFPKGQANIQYGGEMSNISDDSFGNLNAQPQRQNRETRYKPPDFMFDDK